MRFHMFKKRFVLSTVGLVFSIGCEQKMPQAQPSSTSAMPPNITIDDVKRDAASSMNTTAAYSQQEKDKIVADMKEKLAVMDANIERLRLKGKNLASDAKAKWDVKMANLDENRKSANDKLAEFGASTSKAWSDVEAGAKSAWAELSKAFQEASNEF